MHFSLSTLIVAQAVTGLAAVMPLPKSAPLPEGATVWRPLVGRQLTAPRLIPATAVSLVYTPAPPLYSPVPGRPAPITASKDRAVVTGNMKIPSVVLEAVTATVSCTTSQVSVVFKNDAGLADAKKWPTKDLLLLTTEAGGCAKPGERGVWIISGSKFDDKAKSGVFAAKQTSLTEQLSDVDITFKTAGAPKTKRGLDLKLNADLSGKNIIKQGPFSMDADVAKYTGDILISGGLKFDFLKLKLTSMFIDLNYDSIFDLNLTTSVKSGKDLAKWDIKPISQSVSAFTIPGVLDVGPILEFGLGAEIGVKGSVVLKTDIHTEFKGSSVHINFLDTKKNVAKNWTPVSTVKNELDIQTSLQMNPYVSAQVGLGVKAFGGKVDLTGSVTAKATMVNSFNVQADVAFTSAITDVKFVAPTNVKACPNGAWFASTLDTSVVAAVGTLAKADLFKNQLPIYKSACWSFAPGKPAPGKPAPGKPAPGKPAAGKPAAGKRDQLEIAAF
ncbi:hypothetical protein GGTG_07181 [Gaeumannomyces tritici R3-111a-1]|uniref:DUF7029 domain-containing protein n=1 Tax=Gaeumannomyces tritici (strain R3-111a-1) TaxID=644352 RepID=J3P0Y5_GAET3|nr:hypothetical protein GGTG_07181 [Gaeumannomyces tritici R3-111a-1]EJT77269.1 hypothetical protein GGTG_07181 [Gaeumannomyces tritici R3-111a-1]